MRCITAERARKSLFKLLDKIADSHEPVQITGQRNNAVLVNEDDWRAIHETLYLLSIPKMRGSIREGLTTSLNKCERKPHWEAEKIIL